MIVELIKTVLFGIIQGITEWLPISSTGHMILFNSIWPMELSLENPRFWGLFLVVIQFGSILAVVLLYFHKLNPFSRRKSISERRATWTLWEKVLIASLPAAVLGLLLNDWIESKMQNALVVAIMLIVYGVLFLVMESKKRHAVIRRLSEIDVKTSLGIGFFQVLAMIPGTSRSGATILGASLLGTDRKIASEFSFFCAIPVMLGASGLKIFKYVWDGNPIPSGEEMTILLVAMAVSFIVSVFAIRMLLSYIRRHDFKIFGYYRIILGVAILLFAYVLAPMMGISINLNV